MPAAYPLSIQVHSLFNTSVGAEPSFGYSWFSTTKNRRRFNMTLQSAYVSIKNSLMASYANTYREEVGYWLQNLIAARSIQLTRLYAVTRQYKIENPELNLNSREAIIHLLHATLGLCFYPLKIFPLLLL